MSPLRTEPDIHQLIRWQLRVDEKISGCWSADVYDVRVRLTYTGRLINQLGKPLTDVLHGGRETALLARIRATHYYCRQMSPQWPVATARTGSFPHSRRHLVPASASPT